MTIKTNQAGFTSAELNTPNFAHLEASLGVMSFFVKMGDNGDHGWNFDEEACREAAEFFTHLAHELRRRQDENLSIYGTDV